MWRSLRWSFLHLDRGLRLHRGRLHLGGGRTDGVHDVVVARAAAQVPLDSVSDLVVAGRRIAREEIDRGDHQPRRAEAALERVLHRERTLDRMELAILCETFDRGDLRALSLDGEDRARLRRTAVDEHRAGPALAGVTAAAPS